MPSKKFAPDTIYMTYDTRLLLAARNAELQEKLFLFGRDIQRIKR